MGGIDAHVKRTIQRTVRLSAVRMLSSPRRLAARYGACILALPKLNQVVQERRTYGPAWILVQHIEETQSALEAFIIDTICNMPFQHKLCTELIAGPSKA